MRITSIFHAFLVLILTFASCSESKHEGTTGKVELNEGKRWKANPETKTGIANMQAIVSNVENTNGDSVLVKTSILLKDEFDLIFKNCTMTGPGHDQLHNHLLPMLGWMKRMKSNDPEVAELAFTEISAHLQEYSSYFE